MTNQEIFDTVIDIINKQAEEFYKVDLEGKEKIIYSNQVLLDLARKIQPKLL
jgi:hypothetical protein